MLSKREKAARRDKREMRASLRRYEADRAALAVPLPKPMLGDIPYDGQQCPKCERWFHRRHFAGAKRCEECQAAAVRRSA